MHPTRLRFTVRFWMAAVAVSCVPICCVRFGQRFPLDSGCRPSCQNHLKNIALALLQYSTHTGVFPYASVPNPGLPVQRRLSWHTAVLPYYDNQDIYNMIDRSGAWDDPSNGQFTQTSISLLRCPSQSVGSPYHWTHYVGVSGLGPDSPWLQAGHPRSGVFGHNRVTRLSDLKDGAANTLVVTETARRNGPWAAGGDPTVRPVDPAARPYIGPGRPFGGLGTDGANAAFADGSVRHISATINPQVFEAISTVAGGESLPENWIP
ncbi:MAG: DUF1559 domain-containing protein [Isosphaeraceae bacterium]